MNREQMKVENKYDYSEHSQIEHFINDVKYATISLNSECKKLTSEYQEDILSIDILPVKERFINDYEALFQLLNYKLHTDGMMLPKKEFHTLIDRYMNELDVIIQNMNQLIHIQQKYHKRFLLHPMNHLKNMMEFSTRFLETNSPIIPSMYWLNLEHYEQIRTYMDETQTRVEDLQRAKKRILKVWDPMILDDTYEEILEEFQKVQDGNLKFLNTSFWKIRKQLRRLFVEDIELLNEQEYKTLYHNRKIVKENTDWLNKEEKNILMVFGKAYKGEATSFEEIRQGYERLYSFLNEYYKVDFSHVVNLIEEIFPESEELIWSGKGFHEIIDLCHETKVLLRKLNDDYFLFYHKLKKQNEEYTVNDMRKTIYLIERIQQKKKWLSSNNDKIISVFGTNQFTSKTDWKQYLIQQANTQATYEFPIYQEFVCSDVWDNKLYDLFKAIIIQEQPVHEKLVLKRAANICGLVRVTPSLKKELQQFLKTYETEYKVIDGFWQLNDNVQYELRLPGSEKREISMISDSELKVGILKFIEIEHEITLDQLGKIMCEKLGFQRRNQAFMDCMERLVKELKKEGRIIRKSAGWQLT